MTEFTPVVGARYRVTDSNGRKALVFVNGPPQTDAYGNRLVHAQAEEFEDARGEMHKTLTHSAPLLISALTWDLVEEPKTPATGYCWEVSSLFGLGSGSFPASIKSR